MSLEKFARDAANPQSDEYRKLSALPSWDAVIECALDAGAISRERASSLMSINWRESFSKFVSRGDPRVRNAKEMFQVPAGAFLAFIRVDAPDAYHSFVGDRLGRRHIVHAMISLGEGEAAGNGNSVLGIGSNDGWQVLNLAKDLHWIPGSISFNAVPLGVAKSRPLRIRYRGLARMQEPVQGEMLIDLDELRAVRLLERSIEENTRKMFEGSRLTVKKTSVLADIKDIASAARAFREVGARDAAPSADEGPIRALLSELFDNAPEELVRQALGDSFLEIIESVTPFVGAIKSGAKALFGWGTMVKQFNARSRAVTAGGSFSPGDPAAAFAAILNCQEREMKRIATVASVHTVSALSRGMFSVADLGIASGPLLNAAEKLSLLIHKIFLFSRDWNETAAANKMLDSGPFDLRLFEVNPLLGCYLIANSNTSHVINMAVASYGRPNWNIEVESMVKAAEPVFTAARSLIRASRFEIASMSAMKGGVRDSTATTLKLPTGRLAAVFDSIANKINRVGQR